MNINGTNDAEEAHPGCLWAKQSALFRLTSSFGRG